MWISILNCLLVRANSQARAKEHAMFEQQSNESLNCSKFYEKLFTNICKLIYISLITIHMKRYECNIPMVFLNLWTFLSDPSFLSKVEGGGAFCE